MPDQRLEYTFLESGFRKLINTNQRVLKLWSGCAWAEGPVYFRDGDFLLWSDIPNDRILRFVPDLGGLSGTVSVFRQPANYTNGHTRDREGRLVSCEHGGRRVTRTEPDGTITMLTDRYEGKRLNSPNDVVVKSDGTVWFTDPPYGHLSDLEGSKGESELGRCYVFRFDPGTGRLAIVADDFVCPNGLCFSPDEKLLYIADTGGSHHLNGPKHIRVFAVRGDNTLVDGQLFADCDYGMFDGLRCDDFGNIWTSAGDGIHVFDSGGTLLGKIMVPEVVANLTFGGRKRNRLYICGTTSLYAVHVTCNGAQTP